MSDIIQRLRDAYAENPASALKLLPKLFQTADSGKIMEALPTKIYLIEGWYCRTCHKRHERIREIAVGKNVFLTRYAAEKALKERSNSD